MRDLLRTPRWLGFSVLVVVVIIGFGFLSRWQWSRAEEKREEKAALVAQSAAAAAPVGDVLRPAGPWDPTMEWRTVTARGTYDAAGQVLVRKRPLNGQNGFWVLAPLRTDAGPVLWVNRGWLAATGNARDVQPAPPPPTGEVVVTGRLRAAEEAPRPQPADLPAGQVTDADPAVLGGGTSAYPAYVELVSSEPADGGGLTALPLPEIDEGRNISYAVQWILFALVAITGWFFFLRREARYVAEERAGVPPQVQATP